MKSVIKNKHNQGRIHSQKFIYILSILVLLAFTSCHSLNQTSVENTNPANPSEENEQGTADFTVPKSEVNLSKPLVVSSKPDDMALCQSINETIDKSEFSNARWGVFVASMKDGRIVCERDGRKLFNPASIQKTLTAIVALETLGADYRWKTSIYANNEISNGTINGDLVLYGTGAPDFDSKGLENLVSQLQAKGLKTVKGNVIGDESYFRGENIGDGWTWNELQWYYGAEASALSFNSNQAFISVDNGNANASTEYIQVSVGQQPTNSSNANNEPSGIERGLADNNFYVWGKAKAFGARVAVNNPALITSKTFKNLLEKRGITIEGDALSANWKSENKLDVNKSTELATVESQTLGEAVRHMNKHSDNLYAELLLRAIGRKSRETAPSDNARPQEVRGDDSAGTAIVTKMLREHNVATEEIQIHDGSGLSRLDFVTPESFARAFIYAAQSPFGQFFADSLPIAATDGTLGGRLGKVKGKVIAKTGTVTYVNSLAGYASHPSGETYTFAVICNNATRRNDAARTIDAAVALMAGASKDNEKGKDTKNSGNVINANSNSNANNLFNFSR